MDGVTVLLATYNGARYLNEQIASLHRQTVSSLHVIASDDGSSDSTHDILARWAASWDKGSFTVIEGPQAGFAENFRHLLCQTVPGSGLVAFSDQDDIWAPDKLARASTKIGHLQGAALYCSRTDLIGPDGEPLGASPLFSRPPHFRNALVQSIGGGNTMVLNAPAFAILAQSARRTSFVSHDWWAYIIVAGAGGTVIYDPQSHILYRQHDANLVGHNKGWRARLTRIRGLFEGRFAAWSGQNLAALEACKDLLTPENRQILAQFASARSASLLKRIGAFRKIGLYRQTTAGTLALHLAVLTNRI